MATLNKEIFQSIKDEVFGVQSKRVEVAEGYEVNVIQLTAEAALALAHMGADGDDNAMFAWAAACTVDDDFNPIFTVDDIRTLPQAVVRPILDEVIALNGLISTEASEEAEKNSEEAES